MVLFPRGVDPRGPELFTVEIEPAIAERVVARRQKAGKGSLMDDFFWPLVKDNVLKAMARTVSVPLNQPAITAITITDERWFLRIGERSFRKGDWLYDRRSERTKARLHVSEILV